MQKQAVAQCQLCTRYAVTVIQLCGCPGYSRSGDTAESWLDGARGWKAPGGRLATRGWQASIPGPCPLKITYTYQDIFTGSKYIVTEMYVAFRPQSGSMEWLCVRLSVYLVYWGTCCLTWKKGLYLYGCHSCPYMSYQEVDNMVKNIMSREVILCHITQ